MRICGKIDHVAATTVPALPSAQVLPSMMAATSKGVPDAGSFDLMADLGLPPAPKSAPKPAAAPILPVTTSNMPTASGPHLLLTADKGKGLQLLGMLMRVGEDMFFELLLENHLSVPMSEFAVQFNKNAFGLVPDAPFKISEPLEAGASDTMLLPLRFGGEVDAGKGAAIQLAMKCSPCGVLYAMDQITTELDAVLDGKGRIDGTSFESGWSASASGPIVAKTVSMAPISRTESLVTKLEECRVLRVNRPSRDPNLLSFSARTVGSGITFLLELTCRGATTCSIELRALGTVPKSLTTAMTATLERLLLETN